MNNNHKNVKNLIKILVIVGFLLILVSVLIQYINPYIDEMSMRKRDERRIEYIEEMSSILTALYEKHPEYYKGRQKVVYISVPSLYETCDDIDLPKLPIGWSYNCASNQNLKKIDGTGWIPVDLTKVSGANKIKELTFNSTKNQLYYIYIADEDDWVITAPLESEYYLQKRAVNDKGINNMRLEIGSFPAIASESEYLFGYWKVNFNNRQLGNNLITDKSGNNNHGLINEKGFVTIPSTPSFNQLGETGTEYTVSLWFKTSASKDQSLTEKWHGNTYPWALRGPMPNISFAVYDGERNPVATANDNYNDNRWHYLVAVKNFQRQTLELYIDGALKSEVADTTVSKTSNNGGFFIGARNMNGDHPFAGEIREMRVYGRAYDSKEISKNYRASKQFILR